MKEFIEIISKNELFKNINADETEKLLSCLGAQTHYYRKNEFLWMQGDITFSIGIVIHGQVNVLKEDIAGNRSLISSFRAPEIFGESLVCSGILQSPVSVQASEDTTIMTIEFLKLIKTCKNSCGFHTRLIQNMLKIIADKNINFNRKLDYLSKKTIQQKVASYILDNVESKDNLSVSIPFNREELADFMGINRSALSRELSKMRNNNIINFNKNIFQILDLKVLVSLADN